LTLCGAHFELNVASILVAELPQPDTQRLHNGIVHRWVCEEQAYHGHSVGLVRHSYADHACKSEQHCYRVAAHWIISSAPNRIGCEMVNDRVGAADVQTNRTKVRKIAKLFLHGLMHAIPGSAAAIGSFSTWLEPRPALRTVRRRPNAYPAKMYAQPCATAP